MIRARGVVARCAVAVALAASLAACSTGGGESGDVPAASEPRSVSGITALELSTAGRVAVTQAETEALVIDAEPAVLPKLTSDVVDGVLQLGVKPGESFDTDQQIIYRLSVKHLDGITISGSGTLNFPGMAASTLRAEMSGSGRMTLAGTADRVEMTVDGSGAISGEKLAAKTGSAEISGSGDAVLQVSDTLEATISGSGSIVYYGEPKVTEDVSGSGKIVKGP